MMNKICEQLDYFRIRQIIAGYCMTTEGKEKLLRRLPYTDINIINQRKSEASEWLQYLSVGGQNAILSFDNVSNLFNIVKIDGAVLELDQLYELGKFCKSVILAKNLLSIENKKSLEKDGVFVNELPNLNSIAHKLPNLQESLNIIFKIIDEDGQLRDLPQLRLIRQSIQRIRKEIEALIKSYTSNPHLKDILQSDVPVLRGERQVLAIKSNSKNRIPGIVHEMSQTGQTAYIEPEEVVKKNNDLIQEEFRLQQELRRILKDVTRELKIFIEDFIFAHRLIIRLDCALAVAKWCKETNGVFAISKEDTEKIILKKARHPILGSLAVPIDVEFFDECKILIITGPNTGGKTVTLKTIALFALLNQAGFSVPAMEGTYLPIFDNIFADIGDGQSLDESLSTFSSHMKNIAIAIKNATNKSLILLDELGSGTDPQEGGAIAMAILDEILAKSSYALVTTHHGIIKNYAYTHKHCVNASVEFNSQSLMPTYKILMGVPGESHALEIASQSGLNKRIINNAKKYLVSEGSDVSALIKGLTEKHEELNELEKEAEKKQKHIAEKWRKVDLKDLRLRQKELELREQGYKKTQNFIAESRSMLENLVRELREGEITREKTLKVKETIKNLEDVVNEEKEKLILENQSIYELQSKIENTEFSELQDDNLAKQIKFNIGDEVYVGSKKRQGIIIDKAKNNNWVVQFGSLKMNVVEKDLKLIPQKAESKNNLSITVEMINDVDNVVLGKEDSRVSFKTTLSDKPVFELRLLGMRYEDAMKALERQLDLCALNSFHSFSIIHGKGTGVLQEGVHKMLKNYPGIINYYFAKPEDGGTGKTYVEM